jgi:tetratricopeptide (TPR) repeat protein
MRRSLVAVLMVTAGCAPKLYVNVLRPATVNLGPVKQLAVVETEGRLDARERVVRELVSATGAAGYFTVTERPGSKAAPGEIALALAVLEYSAAPDPASEKHASWIGKVVVSVTATDETGRALVSARPYRGNITSDGGEEEAYAGATRMAVSALLDDFTPSYARQAIELDEEDVAERPIVELARRGDIKGAIVQERQRVASTPTAAASYNLAALLDSQGEYAEALTLYDQALKLSMKELYAEARGACARRLADVQALGH